MPFTFGLIMFQKFKITSLTISLLLISGCATITKDKTQSVTVTTSCANKAVNGASCSLTNENGTWQANTPNPVQIHKAYNDLSIACKIGQSSATKTFESSANGGAWGNILFGGLIGFLIDKSNGAGFDYPTTLSLDLDPCYETSNK
jgi:hypothetical protein